MPIQVVEMTTLLKISGISSEVNVTTEIFNRSNLSLRERWRMGGICIFTHRGTGKQIPFKKKNRRRVELNIFTLIIVWHLWIHVSSDRHTQTSPVGELRSELGIVLAKIQLKSKQNGYIPNEKTVNTNGIEWTVCVLVLLKIRTDTTMAEASLQRGWLSWCCVWSPFMG